MMDREVILSPFSRMFHFRKYFLKFIMFCVGGSTLEAAARMQFCPYRSQTHTHTEVKIKSRLSIVYIRVRRKNYNALKT